PGDGHRVLILAAEVLAGSDVAHILPVAIHAYVRDNHRAPIDGIRLEYVLVDHRHVAQRDLLAGVDGFLRLLLVDGAADDSDPDHDHAQVDEIAPVTAAVPPEQAP